MPTETFLCRYCGETHKMVIQVGIHTLRLRPPDEGVCVSVWPAVADNATNALKDRVARAIGELHEIGRRCSTRYGAINAQADASREREPEDPESVRVGDTIRLRIAQGHYEEIVEAVVELHRCCPGVFFFEYERRVGGFHPLCEFYERGPNSRDEYEPNYGEYVSDLVPGWVIVRRKED